MSDWRSGLVMLLAGYIYKTMDQIPTRCSTERYVHAVECDHNRIGLIWWSACADVLRHGCGSQGRICDPFDSAVKLHAGCRIHGKKPSWILIDKSLPIFQQNITTKTNIVNHPSFCLIPHVSHFT